MLGRLKAKFRTLNGKQTRLAVSIASVFGGIFVAAGLAMNSNSLVVRLDLVAAILEFLALTITWHALERAKRPASDAWNYGLAKLENLCGLLIAQVQILMLLVFLWIAFDRFGQPVQPQGAGWALIFYASAGGVTGAMLAWAAQLVRKEPGPVAYALLGSYQVKTAAAIGTAILMAIATFFPDLPITPYLDPINVVALCAIRIRAIARTILHSGRDLLDAAVEEATKIAIYGAMVRRYALYDDLLRVETRRNPNSVFVTLHLAFDEGRSLSDVFAAIQALQEEVRNTVADSEVVVVPYPLRDERSATPAAAAA